MKINYVIPFYIIDGFIDGSRNNTYHRIDKFFAVKSHVFTLYKKFMPDVVKATFVINKSDCVKEGEIEDIIDNLRKKYKQPDEIPIEVKYRDNWGYSYGAWEYHMRESLNEQYDYYFLTEDDYIVARQDLVFYEPFLKKFTEKTAFVCGLWAGPPPNGPDKQIGHPAISYGLYSAKACENVLNKCGEIFFDYNHRSSTKGAYDGWQGNYHNHFIDCGYEIDHTIDLIPTVFRNRVYGVHGPPVILPLI